MLRRCFGPLVVATFLCQAPSLVQAQSDTESTAGSVDKPVGKEFEILFRLSTELIEDLTRHEVEMTVPVSRTVEGMPLTGTASGKGITSVNVVESDDQAEFSISMTGNATGRLRSDAGPAIVRLTTRAQFVTTKRIQFDGNAFFMSPAETDAKNCTTIDRLCAKRRGVIGGLVEQVGSRIAKKSLPDINQRAQDITTEMLSDTFDEAGEDLLSRLNDTADFDEMLDKYFPETKGWTYKTAARKDAIIAGLGPEDATFPSIVLNDEYPTQAHAEIWLKLTPGQAAMLQLLGDMDIVYDLLREAMPDQDAETLAEDVKLTRQGDWSIILVGLPANDAKFSKPK